MLGMGPVTIAVDSYGPVTDNAQSVYELSLIEDDKEKAKKEIEEQFGFTPDFEKAKYYLEANDGAGNTFKATAKPVLIGTAVAGATTMIFSLILMIQKTLNINPTETLNLLNPYSMLGFILPRMRCMMLSASCLLVVSRCFLLWDLAVLFLVSCLPLCQVLLSHR